MGIQFVNPGSQALLDNILNNVALPFPLRYHLYSNIFAPTPTTVLGDLTESSATGYAPQDVPQAGWTFSVPSTGTVRAVNADIAFTVTSTLVAFGLYVTTFAGDLLFAEEFSTPVSFGSMGGTVTLTPTIDFHSPIA
jgi:hypothetical protein